MWISDNDYGRHVNITRRVDELIPPTGRAYFDVRVPTSASYHVVPQAGEFVDGFGGNGG